MRVTAGIFLASILIKEMLFLVYIRYLWCDVIKELQAIEATGTGYICCVCDAEFEIATELEDHMSMYVNVLFG
jgi:hypothetical protein